VVIISGGWGLKTRLLTEEEILLDWLGERLYASPGFPVPGPLLAVPPPPRLDVELAFRRLVEEELYGGRRENGKGRLLKRF